MKSLTGKNALVTGAGSGLGKDIALLLAREGAFVGVADIHLPAAEEVVGIIRELGGEALAVCMDVSDEQQTEAGTGAFPPTLIFSAGLDPLRDENFAFVARLKEAGVPVKHVHFPGMVHAFLMLDNLAPQQNQQLYQDTASFVAAGKKS